MREHLADGSVRCVVTSIPFGALFSYSHKAADVGNCRDGTTFLDTQFGLHMRWWFAEIERVLSPGCLCCIHVQQLNATQIQHGHMGLRDFRGAVIDLARRHGLQPHGEVAIPKNPQRVAQVRKLHSLLFVSGKRDSRALAPANNDFMLLFRKPGDDGEPVRGLHDQRENPGGQFSKEQWIRWAKGTWTDLPRTLWEVEREVLKAAEGVADLLGASEPELRRAAATLAAALIDQGAGRADLLEGEEELLLAAAEEEWRTAGVWADILETDILDGWRSARGSDEERHVCPLQLEVIRRCLLLYTNPGDLVLDPFMGIGSVAVVALELGRRCVGWELKESYHQLAIRNVQHWRRRLATTGQVDLFGGSDAAVV